MVNIIGLVEQRLRENSNDTVKIAIKRFFKEDIKVFGVSSATVKKITRELSNIVKDRTKNEIFDICEELWSSGYLEKCSIACELAYSVRVLYTVDDFKTFDHWVSRYIHNWANCDHFCNHTVGTFLEMYPQFITDLKIWTESENRWKKRASAVSLIVPAHRGLFLSDIMAIADKLLLDKDDMVQKGFGWMLKAASESCPEKIFDYIMVRKDTMPRTAFRYALEKMPEEWRNKAMSEPRSRKKTRKIDC
jgi:3-methyladenine DNA glycosylase AlkD